MNSVSKSSISLFSLLLGVWGIASLIFLVVDLDAILVVSWLVCCILIYVYRLDFFVKYIHYVFFLSLNLFGVYSIENSCFFLTELNRLSEDYDALYPIFVIHFCFLLFLLLFDGIFPSVNEKSKPIVDIKLTNNDLLGLIINVLGAFFLFISLFLFIKAAVRPAFILGFDRFEYSQRYISGIWGIVNKFSGWLLPIVPLLLVCNKYKLGLSSLFIYLVYLFLIGNKFGSFFNIIVLLTPYIVVRFNLKKISQKTLLITSISFVGAGALLVLVLYVFHKLTYGYSLDTFALYLNQRMAQQGQMWWAVYGECKTLPMHLNEIGDEIIGFWGLDSVIPSEMNYGIYKMMQLVTPYEIYVSKILSGSRYSTSTCASIYYYTKFWGFAILLPIASAFLAYVVNWYWRALYNREIIGVIVAWIIIGRLATIYSMSEFQMVFNLKYLIVIIVAIIVDKYLAVRTRNGQLSISES